MPAAKLVCRTRVRSSLPAPLAPTVPHSRSHLVPPQHVARKAPPRRVESTQARSRSRAPAPPRHAPPRPATTAPRAPRGRRRAAVAPRGSSDARLNEPRGSSVPQGSGRRRCARRIPDVRLRWGAGAAHPLTSPSRCRCVARGQGTDAHYVATRRRQLAHGSSIAFDAVRGSRDRPQMRDAAV